MKILIVDDEPQVAEILAKSLGREGHQATIATSGEQALSLVGTYDPDALFLDNTRKEWDMITRITPGVTFEVGEPTYRLAAGYFFTADLYARHPELNQAFDAHSFIGDAVWKASPLLTLNAFDTFTLTTDTNLMNQESVATGRNRSYSNYMGGGASYQVDPRTTVRGGALWVVQHFQSGDLFDSDTYGLDLAVDRAFTPRFTGTIGYEYRFFDIQNLPDTTTHTPRLGVRFRFTETITGTLSAGPTLQLVGVAQSQHRRPGLHAPGPGDLPSANRHRAHRRLPVLPSALGEPRLDAGGNRDRGRRRPEPSVGRHPVRLPLHQPKTLGNRLAFAWFVAGVASTATVAALRARSLTPLRSVRAGLFNIHHDYSRCSFLTPPTATTGDAESLS